MLLTMLIIMLLAALAPRASALTEDELVEQQEDAAGTASVADSVPSDALDALDELGIDPERPTDSMKKFTISDLFGLLKNELTGVISAPLHSLAAILAAVLLVSLTSSEKHRVLRAAAVAGAGVAVIAPIASLAATAAEALSDCSVFMTASIPVFSTLTVSSGMPVSSAFMNGSMLVLSNVISKVAANVLLPVACIALAFSAVGAFVPELKTERIASGVRTFAVWSIGAALALYLTFIGIQSGISSSLDGLTQKTLKVTVSGSIPIIGGIISDASDTVFGAAQLIRSGLGGFSLVVIVLVFAKPILTAAAWSLALRIGEFAAASFGGDDVAALTGAARKTVTVIISLLAAAAVAVTVSVAIIVRLRA